jgi:hypothetical protein
MAKKTAAYVVKQIEVNEIAGEQVKCLATVAGFPSLAAARKFCDRRWGGNPPQGAVIVHRSGERFDPPTGTTI